MAHPKTSQKRAKAVSASIFLVGLGIISFTNILWPGIMLVIGIPLAIRQYMLGKTYDAIVSLVIFVGAFIVSSCNVSWEIILPIIFFTSAIYILVREFCESTITTESEDEENLNKSIEEDKDEK